MSATCSRLPRFARTLAAGWLVLLAAFAPAQPKPDAVLLPAKEYQALLDQLEAFRKAKDAKPAPPSECHIRGRIELRGSRSIAALAITYRYRTAAPHSPVALGTQRAFLAKVTPAGTPLVDADGLIVSPDAAGDYTLTLDIEAPVGPRGGKGELGFELGLPRAAITTLALAPPGVAKFAVTTRGPGEAKRVAEEAARFAVPDGTHGPPLGAVESVEVAWDAPTQAVPAVEAPPSVDAEITVRLDEMQVETVAKLRLRGPPRAWEFRFPATATATADRGTLAHADPKAVWTLAQTEPGETVVTVTARQPRPDAKHAGPYPVGPFAAKDVPTQTGRVRVFAPVNLLLAPKSPPEVRRQDVPPAAPGEEAPAALFRYAAIPANELLSLEVRPTRGFVLVTPFHRLRLTEAGWRLRAELHIKPVRTELEQFAFELPPGWQNLDVLPPELVGEVNESPKGRFTVRLPAPRREPFDLILEATWPLAPTAREAQVPLPRFPQAQERAAQLSAAVPDGFEVRGTAREWDGKKVGDDPLELKPTGTRFDAGAARVDLAWQPYRPELSAEVFAEVTPYDRQLGIAQTIRLTASEPLPRAVKLKGPANALGFLSQPGAEPLAPGEWQISIPAGAKEFAVSLKFAVPAGARWNVPLVWPDAARTTARVRVWGGGTVRRSTRFEGPWRELPPEATAESDALPWLTLAGTGTGLPLTLEPGEATGPTSVVERGAIQAILADDGAPQLRARFVVRRWAASGLELEVPSPVPPAVWVNRKRVDPVPGDGVFRIPLPEPKAARPTLELELRYALPPGDTLAPPTIRGAVWRQPVRWLVTVPPTVAPLVPASAFTADVRWRWRSQLFAPGSANTSADLDAWLAGGDDVDADAEPWLASANEPLAGRQAVPGSLTIYRVPRTAWVFGCSIAVLLGGVAASRLRPGLLGPVVACLGVAGAAAAVFWPQVAGQAAAAAEPGAAGLLAWLAGAASVRWLYQRRLARQAVFVRGPAPSGTARAGSASGAG